MTTEIKIPDLPAASALVGTESFETVQSATSKKATADQIIARALRTPAIGTPGTGTAVPVATLPDGAATTASFLMVTVGTDTYAVPAFLVTP